MSEHIGFQNVGVFSVFVIFFGVVCTFAHRIDDLKELDHHFQRGMELSVPDYLTRLSWCFSSHHSEVHRAKQEVEGRELQTDTNLTNVDFERYLNFLFAALTNICLHRELLVLSYRFESAHFNQEALQFKQVKSVIFLKQSLDV